MLASGYSRPLEKLVAESERISTGDLEAWESIESDVTEMHQLARAHDKMRLGLKTLLKIEHDLKIARSIQESTFPERLPGLSICSSPPNFTPPHFQFSSRTERLLSPWPPRDPKIHQNVSRATPTKARNDAISGG